MLLAFTLAGKAIGQGSSFILFSEHGEQFTLFVNGDQKNAKPSDLVRVDGLFGPSFKVRVVFKNPAIPEISKSVFNKINGEMYYVVHPGKKGEYTLDHTTSDYVHHDEAVKEETPPPPPPTENQTTEKTTPAAKKGGCSSPMAEGDFQASVAMISNAPFEANKTSSTKKLVEQHCLTCRQIIEAMHIVSYESSRLSIAKAAYTHCYDPENYSTVKDELNSAGSRSELEQYINSLK
ncbi:MAG TPA: DUF4476 domain-containing protein [Bacteroidales bacterium]|nr:DUF4476 domain-containing protein [Bacteroidales bacterium]